MQKPSSTTSASAHPGLTTSKLPTESSRFSIQTHDEKNEKHENFLKKIHESIQELKSVTVMDFRDRNQRYCPNSNQYLKRNEHFLQKFSKICTTLENLKEKVPKEENKIISLIEEKDHVKQKMDNLKKYIRDARKQIKEEQDLLISQIKEELKEKQDLLISQIKEKQDLLISLLSPETRQLALDNGVNIMINKNPNMLSLEEDKRKIVFSLEQWLK